MCEIRESKTVEGFFQGEGKQKISLLRIVIFPNNVYIFFDLLQ